jgi:hypothetical protein
MGALREVEDLLPSLTRAEKAQLLRIVAQDLDDAFPGVESTPGVCGVSRSVYSQLGDSPVRGAPTGRHEEPVTLPESR